MIKAIGMAGLLLFLTVASAHTGLNADYKVAIHIESHDSSRVCGELPDLGYCSDIRWVYEGCGDVDVFTVFFELVEYRGVEYGLEWPAEWGSGSCTHCGFMALGDIQNPGDGIAITWSTCQSESYVLPAWVWLSATTPGRIDVIPNPPTGIISVCDCEYHEDAPVAVFGGGVCGQEGDDPCEYISPLFIEKHDDVVAGCIAPGGMICYTLVFSNSPWHPNAYDVVVSDSLPAEVGFVEATDGGVYDGASHSVTWSVGTLASGDIDSVALVGVVASDAGPWTILDNYCCLYERGTGMRYNDARCQTTVCGLSPLTLSKTYVIPGDCVSPDDSVTYVLAYGTPGQPADIHNVVLTDELPACLEFVSATGNGAYDPVSRTVEWHLGTLPPESQDSQEVTAHATWDCSPGGTLTNICSIVSDETEAVQDSASFGVCQFAAIVLSKTDDVGEGCIHPGDSISYTIEYETVQPADFHDVTITDVLDPAVIYVSASGNGTYDPDGHSITWSLGTLPQGSWGTENAVVKVRADWIYEYIIENRCEIVSAESPPFVVTLSTSLCGTERSGKAAIHLLPRDDSRTCTQSFPQTDNCEEIISTWASCQVDFFPVFFDLDESQGFEYGLTWPSEWGSIVFVSCSDVTVGEIVQPGDGISQSWSDCSTSPVVFAGYGSVDAAGPGHINIVPHPATGTLKVITCHYGSYETVAEFCGGVCGAECDEPCPGPVRVQPTTWGALKAMFR